MKSVDTDLSNYLQDVLGSQPGISSWQGESQLPYFLRDAFNFRRCDLHGHAMILAFENRGQTKLGRSLRAQLDAVSALAGLPTVYVIPALASHERRRLIVQKIPFIVPGNQMYLPMVGVDLREHFRRPSPLEGKAISPAAQAILITALVRKLWLTAWVPELIARELGYGLMTVSRAVRELTALNLATLVKEGRQHLLRFEHSPSEVWAAATPLLRSPVKRSVWVALASPACAGLRPLPAGLSALASYSMIEEPEWPVYAIGATQWRQAQPFQGIMLEPEDGGGELQLWSYAPRLGPESQSTVDPLSLALSLAGSTDERIQLALDELKEHFPWSKD